MKMIRIGLIGYGNWARQAYLPVLREDKENEIVAYIFPIRSLNSQLVPKENGICYIMSLHSNCVFVITDSYAPAI